MLIYRDVANPHTCRSRSLREQTQNNKLKGSIKTKGDLIAALALRDASEAKLSLEVEIASAVSSTAGIAIHKIKKGTLSLIQRFNAYSHKVRFFKLSAVNNPARSINKGMRQVCIQTNNTPAIGLGSDPSAGSR